MIELVFVSVTNALLLALYVDRQIKRFIQHQKPQMGAPYRDTLSQPAPPDKPRWTIHSHLVIDQNACRWCGMWSWLQRNKRCFGRRRWLSKELLCPQQPHHHVRCGMCKRDWLEDTCDEAPDNLAHRKQLQEELRETVLHEHPNRVVLREGARRGMYSVPTEVNRLREEAVAEARRLGEEK